MPKPVRIDSVKRTEKGLAARLERWGAIRALLTPYTAEDAKKVRQASNKSEKNEIECVTCESYHDLQDAWKKALEWSDGLDHGLSSMLAAIASTATVGDQLWLKIIGCASSGKSCLCEALSIAKKFIVAKSTIRGFHSGFKESGEDTEDNSLLKTLYGKTLVTKDGDTLLQSPNLPQILAEARDIYDGSSRTHYRNKMSKDYEGIRMTWLLCGTSSLRSIDNSELGERFLDCVIMEEIDEEMEDLVLMRVAKKAAENLAIESNGDAQSRNEPDMMRAMQLTGGYVTWLRENASQLIPEITWRDADRLRVAKLGKFIAFMRARPSIVQSENAEREFAARLVSQLVRYTSCLAFVMNEDNISEKVLKQTTRIALDTSRGQTLEIARYLAGQGGSEIKAITLNLGQEPYLTKRLLEFLKKIGVVQTYQVEKVRGIKGQTHWQLTKRFYRLYHTVLPTQEEGASHGH